MPKTAITAMNRSLATAPTKSSGASTASTIRAVVERLKTWKPRIIDAAAAPAPTMQSTRSALSMPSTVMPSRLLVDSHVSTSRCASSVWRVEIRCQAARISSTDPPMINTPAKVAWGGRGCCLVMGPIPPDRPTAPPHGHMSTFSCGCRPLQTSTGAGIPGQPGIPAPVEPVISP
ncbi:hypothetical protein [Nocardioides sp. J9]|uniref:hypothetical protein n=1 Tax=Nocardioides sp. J9 TaxID=935844 RepID=UPI0011A011AA|nr:hypothetical protein [Nocardioides sp. J9]